MEEHYGLVTVQGKPVTLVGPQLTVGNQAPDFTVIGTEMQTVNRDQFKGKILVLLSVPSLDTPVCDLEARRFNQEAANLGADVNVMLVSMDLPFAQKRWCGAAGVERILTVSDHRDASFGTSYGVLIKELRLLARAVFVLDREGVIRYIQLVPEIGKEPDYASVIEAIRKIT
ncbi:MAG: thiol peroxidase [bacterium]